MKKKKAPKKTAVRKKVARPKSPGSWDRDLREQLGYLLKGGGAHVHFMDALEGFPVGQYGVFANALPHTGWQLLEHARIAQWDILEFIRNPKHLSPDFPAGYWPDAEAPPNEKAWTQSVAAFRTDLKAIAELTSSASTDLFAPLPHAKDKTILREVLLVADHNAYHVGELVLLRRLLDAWR